MTKCTELCAKISQLVIEDEKLPSHGQLLQRLGAGANSFGTIEDLRRRSQHCGLCRLALSAICDANDVTKQAEDGHQVEALLFSDETSLRLSYPSRLGTRLAFVAENETRVSGPDNARVVSSSKIDLEMISRWLQTCDKNHKDCVHSQNHRGLKLGNIIDSAPPIFRVIDLQLGCIKEASLDLRYVSLSYVWGQVSTMKLTHNSLERLSQEKSLPEFRSLLPKTINDAIELTLALGERYLWIDALCLIQDDMNDVSLGVGLMNSIYRGSYFTIVAASGEDANAGLPGVLETPRIVRRPTAEVAPGIVMTVQHSIDWHISKSVYNQRGWTLQELVLPRRTLIFLDNQVFFRCQEANWAEDSCSDSLTHWLDDDDSNISRMPEPKHGFLLSFWVYQKLCEEYSHRILRNDGDALRAAVGILRPLGATMRTPMIEGLPAYYLDHFLLFTSADGRMRRREQFASYSWAGSEGAIVWPRENYDWYEDGKATWDEANVLKWLHRKRILEYESISAAGRRTQLTHSQADRPSFLAELLVKHKNAMSAVKQEDVLDQTYKGQESYEQSSYSNNSPNWLDRGNELEISLAMPKHFVTVQSLDLVKSQAEFDRILNNLSDKRELSLIRNWMASKRARAKMISRYGVDVGARSRQTSEHESISQLRPLSSLRGDLPRYTILRFQTIALELVLGTYQAPVVRHSTRTGTREHLPLSRVDGIPLLSGSSSEVVGWLHPDNFKEIPGAGSKLECLVLSWSNTPTVCSAFFQDTLEAMARKKDSAACHDEKQHWNLFWIMYIVWKGSIAERRGIGQILTSALEKPVSPGPTVKSIILG